MSETAGVILVVGGIGCFLLLMLTLGMISEQNEETDHLDLPVEGRIYFMKGGSCMYLDYKACDLRWDGSFLHVRGYIIAEDAILCVTKVGQ